MTKDENGYIVVETVGAFVPFMLLVVSILSLVNIVTIQARVHYAMTQAANTISMYSYVLEVTGMANNLTTMSNKADRTLEDATKFKNNFNAVFKGLESFSDIDKAVEAGEEVVNQFTEAAKDPKEVLRGIMNYTLSEIRNGAFELMVRPMVGRYLSNGDMTGDEYLKKGGVMNRDTGVTGLAALEFYKISNMGKGNSVLIDGKGNIKLVVEYDIEYTFGGLPLPFKPSIRIKQTVITKAWLNGSGKGYS